MSCGFMYSANSATQAVAVGGTINMGTPVRRKGCVKGTATPVINTNGANTTLSGCGKYPEYFNVSTAFVVTPNAAGTVTITVFQDGVAIPGAFASATVAAEATTVTLSIVFGVRLNCGVTSSNITYVLTGADSSVTNAVQTIEKE